jgi:hypothetical protein
MLTTTLRPQLPRRTELHARDEITFTILWFARQIWTRFHLVWVNRVGLLVGDNRTASVHASPSITPCQFLARSDGPVGVHTPKASR